MTNYDEYEDVIKEVSDQLQRARLGDYVELMQKPSRLLLLNFFAGIARGLGVVIGFTIPGAVVIYIIQKIVLMNLPVLGGIISQIVKLIKLGVK